MLRLIHATEDYEYEQARELFLEYVDSLGVDLSFQNIKMELQNIPGEYAPPDGCILLAIDNEQPAGCVALRKIDGIEPAIQLYRSLGFYAIEPYRFNPIEGTLYMEKKLI